MSAACSKTREFFLHGNQQQFEAVFNLYDRTIKLKAEKKSAKPDNVLKLDKWYQNELPKKIKSRGKDPHLIHDELVQVIKWKLARGKFRPNLANLVQMNTPRVVMNETKKAFRNIFKRHDLQAACQALCNLKGIGPAMASAVLAAGAPDIAPFMADECLYAMPDVDSLDYTMKEYMRFVELVNATVERLNAQGGSWNPHKVELAIWTFYVANDLEPEMLEEAKQGKNSNGSTSSSSTTTATCTATSAAAAKKDNENNGDSKFDNGSASAEDSNTSGGCGNEDSNLSPAGVGAGGDSSNHFAAEDSNLSATAEDNSLSSSAVEDDNSNSAHASSNGKGGGYTQQQQQHGRSEEGESSSNGAVENGGRNAAAEEEEEEEKAITNGVSDVGYMTASSLPSEFSAYSYNPPPQDASSLAPIPISTDHHTSSLHWGEPVLPEVSSSLHYDVNTTAAAAAATTTEWPKENEDKAAATSVEEEASSTVLSSSSSAPLKRPSSREEVLEGDLVAKDEDEDVGQPASKKMKEDDASSSAPPQVVTA